MTKSSFREISELDIITSSGQYPERANSPELTSDVIESINRLRVKVNCLLRDLKIDSVSISSGFRPTTINSKANGSKTSAHLIGRAIDIIDTDGVIKRKIQNAPHLLSKYGLWLEHPESTPGWCHLDDKQRRERLIRIFKP